MVGFVSLWSWPAEALLFWQQIWQAILQVVWRQI
jgi:hypothetical protein